MSGSDGNKEKMRKRSAKVTPVAKKDTAAPSVVREEPASEAATAVPEEPRSHKVVWRDPERTSNIPMILFLFLIVTYGLVILYSVSAPAGYINSHLETSAFFVFSQIKFTLGGLAIAIIVNFIPLDFFKKRIILMAAWGVSTGLLAITALFGTDMGQGARRWLPIGGTPFQTSEIFKISIVMMLAIYRVIVIRAQKKGRLKSPTKRGQIIKDAAFEFIIPVGIMLPGAVMILIQPHLSCFIIIATVMVVCFLVSGIRLRSWVIGVAFYLCVLFIAAGVVVAIPSLREKAMDKIESNFAHVFKRVDIYTADEDAEKTDEEKDESLQVNRAKDAIGSGGLMGQGLGNSRYKYSYVSEAHNDYIFSIYVEETGMLGGTLLILMFLLFLGMGLTVAMRAKDVFGRIIATGYTFLITLEALWNIGVELTVLPATGITLPFFSYGGTAQLLLLAGYGMILCVGRSGVLPKTKNGGER